MHHVIPHSPELVQGYGTSHPPLFRLYILISSVPLFGHTRQGDRMRREIPRCPSDGSRSQSDIASVRLPLFSRTKPACIHYFDAVLLAQCPQTFSSSSSISWQSPCPSKRTPSTSSTCGS